jgi:hypothetical protein
MILEIDWQSNKRGWSISSQKDLSGKSGKFINSLDKLTEEQLKDLLDPDSDGWKDYVTPLNAFSQNPRTLEDSFKTLIDSLKPFTKSIIYDQWYYHNIRILDNFYLYEKDLDKLEDLWKGNSVLAPWSDAFVQYLEEHQNNDMRHPYTSLCGKSYIPTNTGWICPCGCSTQKWAHKPFNI